MRLPKFRFTTRRYLALVAIVTISIVGGVEIDRLWKLRQNHLCAVEFHADREQEDLQKLSNVTLARSKGLGNDPLIPVIESLTRRRLDFHQNMKQKWQAAASHSWFSVNDDPDEPTDERIVKKFELGPLPYMKDTIPKLAITPASPNE